MSLDEKALEYHKYPRPGKLAIALTKPTETQADLALAYSPGVAAPVRAISEDPSSARFYTLKNNLVGVITDGSAVLGLGNVGPLAAKPVMEGKGVLFKRFADIDVFDIEVDSHSPQDFINTVSSIAPTFGGINLEDIKGPQCFEIEQALIEKLDIPVFHDDQHGTAIIVAAALKNALMLQDKKLEECKVVCLGAGAAGIASMRLLISMGLKRENLLMIDRTGVIHTGRADLSQHKFAFAVETEKRTLADAMDGADIFIGVSGANIVSQDMLKSMNEKPIVFALSNPDPEISPELAHATRKDLILATGRSDLPNQVNNVLCFPYIFRGALDVGARRINQEMMFAAVDAIAQLAHEKAPEELKALVNNPDNLTFGPNYILPMPMDPRLIQRVPPLVAKAAIATGVARLPYPEHYPKID